MGTTGGTRSGAFARCVGLALLGFAVAATTGCGRKGPPADPSEAGRGLERTEFSPPDPRHLLDLRSPDAAVSSRAMAELAAWLEDVDGPVEKEKARDALIPALDDVARIGREHPEHDARWNAVLVLGLMGYRALPALDTLRGAAKERDPELRKLAVDGLANVASPRLSMFSDLHRQLRQLVIEAQPAERETLSRWNPESPEAAFGALYTDASQKALELVAALMRFDSSVEVQSSALHHLASWGPEAVHHATAVVPFLRHESRDLRQNATYTLRALRPDPDLVVRPLMALIRTERRDMRGEVIIRSAMAALGEAGPGASEALEMLRRLQKEPELADAATKAIAGIEGGGD